MGPRIDDELAVRKYLKVFIGGIPSDASEGELDRHFARYGQVLHVSIHSRDESKAPYGFVTFKFAADSDCAVLEPQHFPGCRRALNMGFASPKKGQDAGKDVQLSEIDPCKVFIGGMGDRDSEEEVGDFFSQWGLVVLVYRDKAWGFVTFATKEAAIRLLEEKSVIFQRRRLDIKPSDSKKSMPQDEKEELIKRAIARHHHKKSMGAMPPAGPPGGYPPPGYYPPPGGAPPPGYYGAPPPGYYGAPPGGAPPGYPPAGYPPPGYAPPGYPPPGQYGGPPPGYYGAPPAPSSSSGGEHPRALPSAGPEYYQQQAPPSDPHSRPYGQDPYGPASGAPAPERGGAPTPDSGYYRNGGDGRPPPSSYTPSADPYYASMGAPSQAPPQGGDPRYRPY